jgi:hypothetical protein
MKAAPLLITWHNENQAIYSVHYDPNGKGRVATAGLDNNIRVGRLLKAALNLPNIRSSGALSPVEKIERSHICPPSPGIRNQSMLSDSVQRVSQTSSRALETQF